MLQIALAVFLMTATPALADQFSIRCAADTLYFLTFDTQPRRMAWEAVQGGTYQGQIDAISDAEIAFSVAAGRDSLAHAFFMRKEGRVDMLNGEQRVLRLADCTPAPTRDIISK